MKKIGFIDYYLDEWHANNYPEFIKNQGNGDFEVAYAWAKIDSPLPDGLTSKEWSETYNIPVLDMYNNGKYELEMYYPSSDGIHPSQEFIKNYTAPQIAEFIRQNYRGK